MARASPDVLVGTLLDERYRIVQHIATGGVGHLYVVEDERARGRVKPCFAAKVLRFEHVENDVLRARFAREIDATSRVLDPYVLRLVHHGQLKKVAGTFDGLKKVVGTLESQLKKVVGTLESQLEKVAGTFDVDGKKVAGTFDVDGKKVAGTLESPLKKVVGTFDGSPKVAGTLEMEKVVGTLDMNDVPYFVAELLTGMDLADALRLKKWLAPLRAVNIATQIARGLATAHAAGVVHRDLKPENVFLAHVADGHEHVKLLDFGLAWMDDDRGDVFSGRLTLARSAIGTPEYMAPEQALGDVGRPSTDIYALGVVLYEMLAGVVPFQGSPEILARKRLRDDPPVLERGSPELHRVVWRALRKDPSGQYESALEMAEALSATPEARGVSARIT